MLINANKFIYHVLISSYFFFKSISIEGFIRTNVCDVYLHKSIAQYRHVSTNNRPQSKLQSSRPFYFFFFHSFQINKPNLSLWNIVPFQSKWENQLEWFMDLHGPTIKYHFTMFGYFKRVYICQSFLNASRDPLCIPCTHTIMRPFRFAFQYDYSIGKMFKYSREAIFQRTKCLSKDLNYLVHAKNFERQNKLKSILAKHEFVVPKSICLETEMKIIELNKTFAKDMITK